MVQAIMGHGSGDHGSALRSNKKPNKFDVTVLTAKDRCGFHHAKSRTNHLGDLSAHFSRAEFACHCCGQLEIETRLLEALEQLRELIGKPIIVHDGYRCPAHNLQVGGVSDSEHTRGMAADVSVDGLTLQEMFDFALRVPAFFNGGIGAYDESFLHVDVRPHPARWARVRGQYVGIQHLVTTPPVVLARGPDRPQPGSQST